MLCEAGRLARANMDDGCWVIGDLALLVKKEYGENRIGEYAKEILQPVAQVKEYRTMARFWKKSARTDFLTLEGISYSHLKLAKRLKKFEAAADFVRECSDHLWTVEKAAIELDKRLGKPEPPVKLLDAIATVRQVETHDPNGAVIVLQCAPGVDGFALEAIDGKTVRLVVWQEEEATIEQS